MEISAKMELKMIKTTTDDMHMFLNNTETGKFSNLIKLEDQDDDMSDLKVEMNFNGPVEEEVVDTNIQELEAEYSQKFAKIRNEVKFLRNITTLLEEGNFKQLLKAKDLFYLRYFNKNLQEGLEDIVKEYLKGVQFVMYYYFRGCPSWSWCYPYFISPFAGDIVFILDDLLRKNPELDFTFDLGEP